ncbi:NEDD8-specific protease 1-like [Homalodisca vitripennis]|uniref:NEDD8-specific protease 1-like n=1 Tax=Homalodisca vitripennis TaxID=197043 RepID=UPI001EEB17B8|nr:NEDD8-specific protease 1-like [Homalodisca vitripennis]
MRDTVKMRSSLALDTYDYVLAAVNNREDETREGGTHWSLLVYTRESNTYCHLDSVEPLNRPHAQRLAVALSGDPDVNVVQIQCRQQKGGVECGAYVVHYIELICSMIVSNISIKAMVVIYGHLLQNQLGENFAVYSVCEVKWQE